MIQVKNRASSPATSPCEPLSENWVKTPPDCSRFAPIRAEIAPGAPEIAPGAPDNAPVAPDNVPESEIREQKFNSTSFLK